MLEHPLHYGNAYNPLGYIAIHKPHHACQVQVLKNFELYQTHTFQTTTVSLTWGANYVQIMYFIQHGMTEVAIQMAQLGVSL